MEEMEIKTGLERVVYSGSSRFLIADALLLLEETLQWLGSPSSS